MLSELENIKNDLRQLRSSFGNTELSSPESLVSKCEEQVKRAMELINYFVEARGTCDFVDYYKSSILSYEITVKERYYKKSGTKDPELWQKLEDTHKVAFAIAQDLYKKHNQPNNGNYSGMLTELLADLYFFNLSKATDSEATDNLCNIVHNLYSLVRDREKALNFDIQVLLPKLIKEFDTKVSQQINSEDNNNAPTL